jgi:hypothetical protein
MIENRKNTIGNAFYRGFMGIGAGVVGMIVMGIIILISWSLIADLFSGNASETTENVFVKTSHPIFVYIVLFATFLATLVGNFFYVYIVSGFIEKYKNIRLTAITHIFWGHVILLFMIVFGYVIANSAEGQGGVTSIAFIHIMLSSVLTFFTVEILTENKYSLLSVYSLLMSACIFIILKGIFGDNFLYFSQPFILGLFGFCQVACEIIYTEFLCKTYGSDFLNREKRIDANNESYLEKNEVRDLDIDI